MSLFPTNVIRPLFEGYSDDYNNICVRHHTPRTEIPPQGFSCTLTNLNTWFGDVPDLFAHNLSNGAYYVHPPYNMTGECFNAFMSDWYDLAIASPESVGDPVPDYAVCVMRVCDLLGADGKTVLPEKTKRASVKPDVNLDVLNRMSNTHAFGPFLKRTALLEHVIILERVQHHRIVARQVGDDTVYVRETAKTPCEWQCIVLVYNRNKPHASVPIVTYIPGVLSDAPSEESSVAHTVVPRPDPHVYV